MIFDKNPSARFYSVSYVDAFAGTGIIHTRELGPLASLLPELQENEKEFRKGSVRRALEIEPPFHRYVFIERSAKKYHELREISRDLPPRNIEVINEDANSALLKWCKNLDSRRERAVVFLDPFGASVSWDVIEALGRTQAVDLWVLFPYSAINRMLPRDRKPPSSWAQRLTAVFGTPEWEEAFYSTHVSQSLLDSLQDVELVSKSVDYRQITDFFVKRLKSVFAGVSKPLPLHNSNGSLLFVLFFAAGNERGARTGLKIANSIIGG